MKRSRRLQLTIIRFVDLARMINYTFSAGTGETFTGTTGNFAEAKNCLNFAVRARKAG